MAWNVKNHDHQIDSSMMLEVEDQPSFIEDDDLYDTDTEMSEEDIRQVQSKLYLSLLTSLNVSNSHEWDIKSKTVTNALRFPNLCEVVTPLDKWITYLHQGQRLDIGTHYHGKSVRDIFSYLLTFIANLIQIGAETDRTPGSLCDDSLSRQGTSRMSLPPINALYTVISRDVALSLLGDETCYGNRMIHPRDQILYPTGLVPRCDTIDCVRCAFLYLTVPLTKCTNCKAKHHYIQVYPHIQNPLFFASDESEFVNHSTNKLRVYQGSIAHQLLYSDTPPLNRVILSYTETRIFKDFPWIVPPHGIAFETPQ